MKDANRLNTPIVHVPSKCDILTSEITKDIDLLGESIGNINPTCDIPNDNVMYVCIEFKKGNRLNLTFEQFEKLAQKGLVSTNNLERYKRAKSMWNKMIIIINEGRTLPA